MKNARHFLFSIDLEDVRNAIPNGHRFRERVPEMTHRYLKFLEKHQSTCTFFVVGNIVKSYPSLIREISSAGHEIACHGFDHTPLDFHTESTFEDDIKKTIDAIVDSGIDEPRGYRAPVFSLTEKVKWAYGILSKYNFLYSSSVLPSRNFNYGWPGADPVPHQVRNKLFEIPVTLFPWPLYTVPFSGGLYFRTLPFWLIRSGFNSTWKKNQPCISYFHPYDIDVEQEKFMHPGLRNNSFYNFMMYRNRSNLFSKFESLIEDGAQITTYKKFVHEHLSNKENLLETAIKSV